MPHFKCVACKIRLHSSECLGGEVGDLCPGCGELLEPVGELTEILGFQSASRPAAVGEPSPAHQRLANRIAEIRSSRGAREQQLDAERWLDDGGSVSPEAVAKAVALPKPRIDA